GEAAHGLFSSAGGLQVPALPALRRLRARRVAAGRRLSRPGSTPSDAVLEALRLGKRLELLERVVLDLTDALPGHAERPADLLQRARLLADEAEAKLDHLTLALG